MLTESIGYQMAEADEPLFIDILDNQLRFYANESDNDFSSASADSSNSDEIRERRANKKASLVPFYEARVEVFTFFDSEKLRKTFRFDRASLECLTRVYCRYD